MTEIKPGGTNAICDAKGPDKCHPNLSIHRTATTTRIRMRGIGIYP